MGAAVVGKGYVFGGIDPGGSRGASLTDATIRG